MKYVVSGKQMKEIDQYSIRDVGISSLVLMERAALAVVEELKKHVTKQDHIWIACGMGNNGADGLAVARLLFLENFQVLAVLAGDPAHATEEYRTQKSINEHLGVPMADYEEFIPGTCDVIVDAVFGVGLSREINGVYEEFLKLLTQAGARYVLAVDIASGIHAGNGQRMGISLQADATVTFGYVKTGQLLYPGKEATGELIVREVGFAPAGIKQAGWEAITYDEEDLSRIPKRSPDSNKGTYGKILIVAGSEGMSGAAFLAALAAYRTGAGLVKLMAPESNRVVLQTLIPEAILETYTEEAFDRTQEETDAWMEQLCSWSDAVVLGPGLGKSEEAYKLTEGILSHAYVPIVLDADALNLVAEHPELTRYFTENIIVTPHPGEMSRLTGKTIDEIKADPIGNARAFGNDYGVVCVQKDAVTIVTDKDGNTFINTTGNSGMAKAGSGDVLTGVIGALLAQGMEVADAAMMGVWLHGRAGDEAATQNSEYGLLARDIANQIQAGREKDETI